MSIPATQSRAEEADLASVERLTHVVVYARDIPSGKLDEDRSMEEAI